MRSYQWARIYKLLVAQFPQKSSWKVKSVSDKWEKLRSQYYRTKKANNNTGACATKFIWYDAIDEILSHIAKANEVPGAMDQGEFVRGTAAALVSLEDEVEGDSEPAWTQSLDPTIPTFAGYGNVETRSTASISPRTRAADLVGCRGQGTSSIAKRPCVDRDLMDTLNRMAESTATIEKMRIEAALAMHKENLLDRQENRRIELEMFKMQQAWNEKLVSLFADVVMRRTTQPPPDVE